SRLFQPFPPKLAAQSQARTLLCKSYLHLIKHVNLVPVVPSAVSTQTCGAILASDLVNLVPVVVFVRAASCESSWCIGFHGLESPLPFQIHAGTNLASSTDALNRVVAPVEQRIGVIAVSIAWRAAFPDRRIRRIWVSKHGLPPCLQRVPA